MKKLRLFPHGFKKIGWILFLPSLVIGTLAYVNDWKIDWLEVKVFGIVSNGLSSSNGYFNFTTKNILLEILAVLGIIGAILIGFSKVKKEDELSMSIRLNALVLAIYSNYAIVILGFLFIHGLVFIHVMTFSMFAVLILFIIIFHYQYYRFKKSFTDEE